MPGHWVRSLRRYGAVLLAAAATTPASAQERAGTLADAQGLFYNGLYEETVGAAAMLIPATEDERLATDELQSSALLFQIKRLLAVDKRGSAGDKLKRCTACPPLIAEFHRVTSRGQLLARERSKTAPADETALFFLGKFDLNYVWLQLEPMGRKTGWNEYWEARRSLDAVLERNPQHVRARVARAWMEYIVDTKLPWGTEWLLGGGDRKKALAWVTTASQGESDVFAIAEAEFALWEMLTRERRLPQAVEVATRLSERFPGNRELTRFVAAKGAPETP